MTFYSRKRYQKSFFIKNGNYDNEITTFTYFARVYNVLKCQYHKTCFSGTTADIFMIKDVFYIVIIYF